MSTATQSTGDELTARQEAALIALLDKGSVAAAAASSGIAESTLWRFLQLPAFQQQYQAARVQLVNVTLARLQSASSAAVDTLSQIASDTAAPVGARISAARAIIAGALRGGELSQQAAPVAALHLHLCGRCNLKFQCSDPSDEEFEVAICPVCKLPENQTAHRM
jgi:hypothetical protein